MIYVLELRNNKYYVGFTSNLDNRLKQHNEGNGTKWTKKYKVLRVLKTFDTNNLFEEDKYTKIYMNKFGIDNVRGGSYCTIILSKEQIYLLNKELRAANNTCFKCGRNNHYVKNCYAKTNIEGKKTDNNKKCFKCGRNNHYTNNCYAKININGEKINDDEIIEDTIKFVSKGIKSIYNWFNS